MMYIVKSSCQQETNWVSRYVYNENHKDMNVLGLPGESTQICTFSSNKFTFLQLKAEKKAAGRTKLYLRLTVE